jgi:hypothetical protein
MTNLPEESAFAPQGVEGVAGGQDADVTPITPLAKAKAAWEAIAENDEDATLDWALEYGDALLHLAATNARPANDVVDRSVYESAVKGRQDFRNAYRKLLPVLKAAEAISRLWRAKGRKVDPTEYWDAINAIDVAVTGGGAKPDPDHLAALAKAGQ